jgi:hypothetical protein
MKRVIVALFAFSLLLAVPLAGCGLINVAGSVLMSGGGLAMALILGLAFGSPSVTPVRKRASSRPAAAALAAPVAGVGEFAADEVAFFEQGEHLHELDDLGSLETPA